MTVQELIDSLMQVSDKSIPVTHGCCCYSCHDCPVTNVNIHRTDEQCLCIDSGYLGPHVEVSG